MYKNRSRGFTLIELLVVIAIIGILSAVVLASLNTARTKGNDAAIKSNLDSIRTQSAIYYDTNNNFGTNAAAVATASAGCTTANTMFANDSSVTQMIAAADLAAGGTAGTISKTQCGMAITGGNWLVQTQLKAVTGTYWCVDSAGQSKQEAAAAGAAATACL